MFGLTPPFFIIPVMDINEHGVGYFKVHVVILEPNRFLFGPQREKTCHRGFRQSETQASLLSYIVQLEYCNFA